MQVNESMDITRARSREESAVTSNTSKFRLGLHSPFLEAQTNPGQAVFPAVAVASLESAAGYSIGAMTHDRLPAQCAHNSVVGADEEVLKEAAVLSEQPKQSVSDCKLPVQSDMVTGTIIILNSVMEEERVVGCA